MKKALIALAFACLSFASYAYDIVREVYIHAKTFVLDAVEALSREDVERKVSKVPMVKAKAFSQRIMKRERPVVTSSWRMCPSV
jgi:hypothetical protein